MKKKPLYTLLSLLIVLSLAVPVWSTVVRADTPTEVSDWYGLDAVRDNLSGHYILMTNLDATTAGYDDLAGADADDGKGWQPIGTSANRFTGVFDGQDFEISDLVIDRPGEDHVGLFGYVAASGIVANVGIANANVTGNDFTGALVGVNFGTIISSCASGSVTGNNRVGALVGENAGTGTVSNSHSSAGVTGNDFVGGVVGANFASVSNSHASASVTGNDRVGGLVGNNQGTVSGSHSAGSVTGNNNVGGLVGLNPGAGTVVLSHAAGSVTGNHQVGGLMGQNWAAVSNSHSSASVTGNNEVGGLVGRNGNTGTLSDSYATGTVTRLSGTSGVFGGFVGINSQGSIVNCYSTGSVHYEGVDDPDDRGFAGSAAEGGNYEMSGNFWDIDTSGQTTTAGDATGKPTVDMMDISTFIDAGWDIAGVADPDNPDPSCTWNMVQGATYPFLVWQYMTIYEIRNWHDLDAVRSDLAGYYVLMNDLDSNTAGYFDFAGEDANGGLGWQPIGTNVDPFTGSFDGQGYEMRDLFIHRPGEDRVGLFGVVDVGGNIENAGIVDATVAGNNRVGALVGENASTGTVSNSHSAGVVTAAGDSVGGLVGLNYGTVSNSHSSAGVTGNEYIGGLVGENTGSGVVSKSHSTGTVSGELFVGGLAGINRGTVSNCHSSGDVAGDLNVGGLVGQNSIAGTVVLSYATVSVTGNGSVGGLTGLNTGIISESFSDSSASGSIYVGGLVGFNGGNGTVSNSYATGTVARLSGIHPLFGGFVGWNNQGQIINCYSTGSVHYQEPYDDPTDKGFAGSVDKGGDYEITDCFWDTETSGQSSSACDDATPKPTEDMMDITTFTDTDTVGLDEAWDMVAVASGETDEGYIWNIIHGRTYPFLSWQDPVELPGALIEGQTREVNCDILEGVTVTASLNGDEVHATSDGDYLLLVPVTGLYQVVASKDGFRPQTRSIDIEDLEEEYTLHFRGDHGLVPNAPDVFYVLQVVNIWLYPPDEECALSVFKVLEVVNAWLYPIEED